MGAPYQSQSVSGYNSSPPPDDGTTVAANKITWNSTIKTKLSDPLNTFIAAVNSQLVTWSDFSSVTTSTNLTTTTAHHMQTIEVTSGSPTIQLGDAATMTKNYTVTVTNTGTGAPVIALATAGNTLDGTAAGTFTFPTGTKTSFTFKVNNGATGYYTEVLGGKTILAQTSVITPIVDSGSTGALSLKTNNGTTQVSIANSGLVEFTGNIDIQGAVIGTNSGQSALTINTGQIGNNAFTQLQVLHTASSNRNVTITGSNGGNPTISTTAGSLAITPNVLIGTNPAQGSVLNIPYNTSLAARNQANGADIGLVSLITQNSVNNVIRIGDGTSSGTFIQAEVGSGAPSASDLPSGFWMLKRDTTGATTKLYYNNGGTIQSVALT